MLSLYICISMLLQDLVVQDLVGLTSMSLQDLVVQDLVGLTSMRLQDLVAYLAGFTLCIAHTIF